MLTDFLFDSDNLVITDFYHYPTTVVYRIAEWDEGFHKGYSGLNEDVKDLFNELITRAEKKLGRELRDNKVAMKVIHKPTNTVLYIGYKDWNWCVGLGLSTYSSKDNIPVEDYDKK